MSHVQIFLTVFVLRVIVASTVESEQVVIVNCGEKTEAQAGQMLTINCSISYSRVGCDVVKYMWETNRDQICNETDSNTRPTYTCGLDKMAHPYLHLNISNVNKNMEGTYRVKVNTDCGLAEESINLTVSNQDLKLNCWEKIEAQAVEMLTINCSIPYNTSDCKVEDYVWETNGHEICNKADYNTSSPTYTCGLDKMTHHYLHLNISNVNKTMEGIYGVRVKATCSHGIFSTSLAKQYKFPDQPALRSSGKRALLVLLGTIVVMVILAYLRTSRKCRSLISYLSREVTQSDTETHRDISDTYNDMNSNPQQKETASMLPPETGEMV